MFFPVRAITNPTCFSIVQSYQLPNLQIRIGLPLFMPSHPAFSDIAGRSLRHTLEQSGAAAEHLGFSNPSDRPNYQSSLLPPTQRHPPFWTRHESLWSFFHARVGTKQAIYHPMGQAVVAALHYHLENFGPYVIHLSPLFHPQVGSLKTGHMSSYVPGGSRFPTR